MPTGNLNYAFFQHVMVFPVNYCGQTLGTATNSVIFRVAEMRVVLLLLYCASECTFITFLNLIKLIFDFVILSRINSYPISKTQKANRENISHGLATGK